MDRVLDAETPTGPVGAQRHLRPPRAVWSFSDYPDACDVIEVLCQTMGGVSDLLVPTDASDECRPWYVRVARDSTLDCAMGDTAIRLAPGLSAAAFRRPPALVEMAQVDRDRQRPVEVALPRIIDPWHLSYISTLGGLGLAPAPQLTQALLLPDDITFDEITRIRWLSPIHAGPDDLADRLNDSSVLRPANLSLYRLSVRPFRTVTSALDGWTSDAAAYARQRGSSIIVIYEPGSLPDLCLIWNLRAMHGWGPRLPLAVPLTGHDDVAINAAAHAVQILNSRTGARIARWPVMLTSETIDRDTLDNLARHLSDKGQPADPVEPTVLLHPAPPPSRTSATTLVLDTTGAGSIPSRTDQDRNQLRGLAQLRNPSPDFELLVTLDHDFMPPSPLLRREDDFAATRYTGGGCAVRANTDELLRVAFPSGWGKLLAVCNDRGVDPTPSASGLTALALLRAVGNLWDVRWLAHRPLLDLLYKKAASHGMSWWKRRSNEQAQAAAVAAANPDEAIRALTAAIEQVSVSHGGESAATFTFSELKNAIGHNEAAGVWMAWAEDKRLVVRGTTLICRHCGHKDWRPIALLAPPLVCPGCLQSNDRPFGETALPFGYRLSEPLRRAIENDSIYHLLVGRTLACILSFGPIPLVGIHPGVEFRRDGRQTEADVAVLLGDGALIPVEVKKSATWFRDHDLQLLDLTADWLDSPTVILATGQADVDVDERFLDLARGDVRPVRRLLTADDWLNPAPVVTMDGRMPGPVADDLGQPQPRSVCDQFDSDFAQAILQSRPHEPPKDPVRARLSSPPR